MTDLVLFGKAISDPTRVRILHALMQSELCVCELVDALQISTSTISTHLQTLRFAGVVETEKRQAWVIYRISPRVLPTLNLALQEFPLDRDIAGQDLHRLSRRMTLRVDGCCVIGTRQLDAQGELVDA